MTLNIKVGVYNSFVAGMFSLCVGRWLFVLGRPWPRDWLHWSWNNNGYDLAYREWAFGPFGEVIRMEDMLRDAEWKEKL
jgi:hypothetical protein